MKIKVFMVQDDEETALWLFGNVHSIYSLAKYYDINTYMLDLYCRKYKDTDSDLLQESEDYVSVSIELDIQGCKCDTIVVNCTNNFNPSVAEKVDKSKYEIIYVTKEKNNV